MQTYLIFYILFFITVGGLVWLIETYLKKL